MAVGSEGVSEEVGYRDASASLIMDGMHIKSILPATLNH